MMPPAPAGFGLEDRGAFGGGVKRPHRCSQRGPAGAHNNSSDACFRWRQRCFGQNRDDVSSHLGDKPDGRAGMSGWQWKTARNQRSFSPFVTAEKHGRKLLAAGLYL